MSSLKRILRSNGILLNLLKFSLKNNDKRDYQKFSFVSTLNQLLGDLEEKIDKIFPNSMKSEPLSYIDLLDSIFKSELEEYKPYIDSGIKKKLIRKFEFLMELTNSSMDMMDGSYSPEVDIIDNEIQKLISILHPLLVAMKS